jgi:hypothetical protein
MRYSAEVQQRPLTAASEHCHRHTELPAMTDKRPEAPLVPHEEAAGSLRRAADCGPMWTGIAGFSPVTEPMVHTLKPNLTPASADRVDRPRPDGPMSNVRCHRHPQGRTEASS